MPEALGASYIFQCFVMTCSLDISNKLWHCRNLTKLSKDRKCAFVCVCVCVALVCVCVCTQLTVLYIVCVCRVCGCVTCCCYICGCVICLHMYLQVCDLQVFVGVSFTSLHMYLWVCHLQACTCIYVCAGLYVCMYVFVQDVSFSSSFSVEMQQVLAGLLQKDPGLRLGCCGKRWAPYRALYYLELGSNQHIKS